MGRVSIKTHITRKSIDKIDHQMNSGIELELGAINQPEWLPHPILFPQVCVYKILSTECNTSPNIH